MTLSLAQLLRLSLAVRSVETSVSMGPEANTMPPSATTASFAPWLRPENALVSEPRKPENLCIHGAAPSPSAAIVFCHMFFII